MLLTIFIPTRNRRHRVAPLVASLIDNLDLPARTDVEILVLNNCSTDDTESALRPLESERVRIVTNTQFFPSSEQNVFHNLHLARGEFVWFLGDDDLPRFRSVLRLLELLREGCADLFISNFRVIEGEGRIGNVSQGRGAPHDETSDIVSLVKRIGLINFFSGWSLIVARRSMLDVAVAQRIAAVNPIYAHCFWLLECFRSAKTRFQVQPLVDYRIFHQEEGWERYTSDQGVGVVYQWSLGLLRLYNQAMQSGVLKPQDIAEIYEYRHNGTRYRAVDEIVFKLTEQADFYVKTGQSRNLLTPAALEEAISILLRIDFTLQDVIARLLKVYEALWAAGEDRAQLLHVYSPLRTAVVELLTRRRDDLCAPYFIQYIYGYLVYDFNARWVAIHGDAGHLLDSVFAQFLPRAMPPHVLVETSHQSLLAAILRQPPKPEPVGERTSFTSMSGKDYAPPQLLPARSLETLHAHGVQPGEDARPLSALLIDGWSYLEEDGVWSIGDGAHLSIRTPAGATQVHLAVQPYLDPGEPRRFRVTIPGGQPHELVLARRETIAVTCAVPSPGDVMFVSIDADPAPAPSALGESIDDRRLGLFLRGVWVEGAG